MSNRRIVYIVFGLCILLASILYLKTDHNIPPETDNSLSVAQENCKEILSPSLDTTTIQIKTESGIYPFLVEIADTQSSRETGLMCRNKISDTSGMLFIFEESNYRSFWMKNTLVPLDILFLDEDLKIINIYEETVPLREDIFYQSNNPAKYVLEIGGGVVQKKDINITSEIALSR